MPRRRTRFQSAVPNPASVCLKDEKSVSYRCIRPLLIGRGLCYSLEKVETRERWYFERNERKWFSFITTWNIFGAIYWLGIITGDFYKLPILVAISIAVGVALVMNRKESFNVKVERFAKGAGNPDIMIMVLILCLQVRFLKLLKEWAE